MEEKVLYVGIDVAKATTKLPKNIQKFRALVRYENSIVKLLNQAAGQLEGCFDEEVEKLIEKILTFLKNFQNK